MIEIGPDTTWQVLLELLGDDVASRRGARPRPGEADAAWGEMRRRVAEYSGIALRNRSGWEQSDTDDVVSTIVLRLQDQRLLERMGRLRAPGGYLVVMIRNAASDLLRRRPRWFTPLEDVDLPAAPEEPSEAGEVESVLVQRLREEIERLGADERLLLELRFWREMSIGEIAAEMRLSYSATAVRLFRLIRKIRGRFSAAESPLEG